MDLFRSWVPKGIGIMMYLFLLIPIMLVNGAYSNNASEMLSSLGIISEHVMYATFMTSIGLVLAGPFIITVIQTYSPRYILIIGLIILFGFNIICGYTQSITLLFTLSLLMGVLRMFLLFTALFGLLGLISGQRVIDKLIKQPASPEQAAKEKYVRGFAQSVIYFFFLTLGQLGSFMTVNISYDYDWQYVYLYLGAAVLIGLLSVLILMKPGHIKISNEYKMPPISQAISAAVCLSAITYMLVYGKTYDWLDDDRICIAFGIAIVSAAIFILQHLLCRRKLIDITAFATPSVIVAMAFFTLVMIMSSSSVLVTTYMGLAMSADSVKSVSLSNWQILGFALGMIINIFLLIKRVHSRWIIFIGFALLSTSAIYMYFQYQSMAQFNSLILPTVIRSTGMWMVYAYCGYCGMDQIDLTKQFGTWVFIMLIFRGVIGPVAGSTAYSNAITYRTQDHVERIAQEYDNVYPEVAQLSIASVKGVIQQQSILATLKELTGWTVYSGFGCMILALIFPYKSWRIRQKKLPVPS